VAFLRFSRDKRGYELFSLVQADQRDGQSRPRVLYAFRTPPNIRVGRDPFDADTKKALEQANPGVSFNWRQIAETPIPSADAEMWRERRRVKKEAKQALKKDEEEAQRAAAGQPSPPGESRSARRRRRRRARQAGSEIPKIEETPAETTKIEETPAETTEDEPPSS
jgi:hypothetical protein